VSTIDILIEYVDLRKRHDEALLEAVHRDLFLPNFPDPDEQEGPDDWAPRLWGEPEPPQPEQHGFVAGTQVMRSERSLAGFAFVERYRESRCALLSYIAVASSRRGQGIGRTLFARALDSARAAGERDGAPLRAVFAEIHDPRRVESDVIAPENRVQIMERLGASRVPVTYVQPALGEGRRSDRLMLIAFPEDAKPVVEAAAVWGFLLEYYAALGVAEPSADPDLRLVQEELKSVGGRAVALEPLTPGA
jgi:GNAT superfamily N-acetyltransferase